MFLLRGGILCASIGRFSCVLARARGEEETRRGRGLVYHRADLEAQGRACAMARFPFLDRPKSTIWVLGFLVNADDEPVVSADTILHLMRLQTRHLRCLQSGQLLHQ